MASADLDRLLDALGHPYRRRLLVALLENNPQEVGETLGVAGAPAPTDGQATAGPHVEELEAIHSHIPKLEQYGYVAFEPETRQVVTGPEWEEVEPILRLFCEHADDLPGGWPDVESTTTGGRA